MEGGLVLNLEKRGLYRPTYWSVDINSEFEFATE